jgi:hypothetical protein
MKYIGMEEDEEGKNDAPGWSDSPTPMQTLAQLEENIDSLTPEEKADLKQLLLRNNKMGNT